MSKKNFYTILGVPKSATKDEIKAAYEHLLSGKAVGRYVVKIKE